MNERIQLMIYSLNEKVGIHWTNEDKIKFAELSVLECVEFLDEKSDHDNFVAKVAPLLAKPKT